MIDGVCPLTTVFPKNTHPTGLGTDINFGVTPGTHTLGIITAKRGFGLLNCAGLKPGPTTAITVEAGHRLLVIVYGLAKDGFRILDGADRGAITNTTRSMLGRTDIKVQVSPMNRMMRIIRILHRAWKGRVRDWL